MFSGFCYDLGCGVTGVEIGLLALFGYVFVSSFVPGFDTGFFSVLGAIL